MLVSLFVACLLFVCFACFGQVLSGFAGVLKCSRFCACYVCCFFLLFCVYLFFACFHFSLSLSFLPVFACFCPFCMIVLVCFLCSCSYMLAFVFLTYFFLLLSFCLRPSFLLSFLFLLSFFGWLFASLLGGLIEAALVCQVGHCAPRQEAQDLMPVRHQGLQVLAHVVWVLIFTNTSTSAWAPHLGGAACVVPLPEQTCPEPIQKHLVMNMKQMLALSDGAMPAQNQHLKSQTFWFCSIQTQVK